MKKKIFIWSLTVIVIAGLIGYRIALRNKFKYSIVKTSTVSSGNVNSYLSTTATVESKNIKQYFGQGIIKTVYVKVGDKVKKGDILLNFDVPDMSSSVRQLEIQYENAKLQKQDAVNQSNIINERIDDLDKQISALQNSKNPADSAKAESLRQQRNSLQPMSDEKLSQLNNSIKIAKINLDAGRQKQSETKDKIISDIDGTVTALSAVEGSTSSNMQPVVTIQDTENLKVTASIGRYDADKVQIGQIANIRSGGKQYKGKISFIEPAAKKTVTQTGGETTLGVDVDILDKAPDLKIDFDTDVDILLGQASNVIKIPAESIRTDKNGRNYVFVVENDSAVERNVKLGLQSDIDAQVIEGVKIGERVILNPSASINNGVKIKEEAGVNK